MSYVYHLIILAVCLHPTKSVSTCPAGAKAFPSNLAGQGKINYANLFSITYHGTYKVIKYSDTLSMYDSGWHPEASMKGKKIPPLVLYQCGTQKPAYSDAGITTSEIRFFEIPIQNATVGWGGPLPFMELLSVTEAISLIDMTYISSPCAQLLEKCTPGVHMKASKSNWSELAANTEIVLTDAFGTGWAGKEKDIPFQISLDPGSLQRAEWVRFVAAFFNEEAKADQIFTEIQTDYNALKAMAVQLKTDSNTEWKGQRPKVAFISKTWDGKLEFVNAQYKIDFVEDAGGQMVPLPATPPANCTYPSNTDGTKKLQCAGSDAGPASFKSFLKEADIIIDESYVYNYAAANYNFTTVYSVTADEIPAYARSPTNVFRLGGSISDAHEGSVGSNWFEQMPSQPQQLLAGMMEAFWSGNFQSPCGFKYLRRVHGQDSSQTTLGHDDCPYYSANGNHNCAAIHTHVHEVAKCSQGASLSGLATTTAASTAIQTTASNNQENANFAAGAELSTALVLAAISSL